MATTTRGLRFFQLISLAVLTLGIQFANSVQLSNMSSFYRFLGAPSHLLPYLGLAAPISGLFIQPLVGQLSDETFTRYGRRRPYIFGWSIVAIIACLMLGAVSSLWLGAIMMALLSCSINGAIEGVRALTGDMVPNYQKATAFSWQTILSGVGAGIAASLPYVLHRYFPAASLDSGEVPRSIKVAFLISGILWLICMWWTLTRVSERLISHQRLYYQQKQRQIHTLKQKTFSIVKKFYRNIRHLPPVMRQFGVVQIFTWMGLYAMWLYFSVALSQHVYGLPASPQQESLPKYAKLFEKSAVETNFYFSIYQYVSVAYALLLPWLTQYFTQRKIHAVSLIIGAMGLIGFNFVKSNLLIIICMVMIGIMWGSIMTLPYAIVSEELPYNKMGVYLGIFNITITLPQIIAGFLLHPLYQYFLHYRAIHIIFLSGLLILIGGVLTWRQSSSLPVTVQS